ncbi:hypothetical protein ABH935_006732 [Catenulispora sp. GAS73]|uniref:hypothetical protein n=1 Tax=Catenulispora sp. GAS73 TaxID=3156269 RepID=UPI003517FB73
MTVAVGDFLHDSVQAGLTAAGASTYLYVSRAPVRAASVVDLQPEQATAGRVASETQSLIARFRAK